MKRGVTSCIAIILVAVCVSGALGVWFLNGIPNQAEAAFGPASPNLGTRQKFLLSWRLTQAEEQLTSPANPFGTEISFSIHPGEMPTSVALRLEEAGLIADAGAFRDFLIYAGLDTQIQVGDYQLSPAVSPIQIGYTLLDATPAEVPFVVLPGWRLEEIAETLPTSGLNISPEVFLAEAQQQNAEGYLLPGTYTVPRVISANALLDLFRTSFEEAVTTEMRAGFANQGLSVDEAVRLAAIVEREAVVDNERTLIASVFLNRLAISMKLEADPTVQYALDFNPTQNTWWTNPLSSADLEFDSPFNTYLYAGLTPGPICNPSLDSLRAVAFPAQTPYYYFRAACDGSGQHNFAETFEEHVGNACP
jgi:UPF0755 protein